jgi:hypothetical protein
MWAHVMHTIVLTLLLQTPAKTFHTRPNMVRRRSKSFDSNAEASDSESEYEEDTRVFGVSLEILLERQRFTHPNLKVPILADKVITYLKEQGK